MNIIGMSLLRSSKRNWNQFTCYFSMWNKSLDWNRQSRWNLWFRSVLTHSVGLSLPCFLSEFHIHNIFGDSWQPMAFSSFRPTSVINMAVFSQWSNSGQQVKHKRFALLTQVSFQLALERNALHEFFHLALVLLDSITYSSEPIRV